MSVKKLVVLLVVPLALLALVPVLQPEMFEGANEASGDALARRIGNFYGAYFVIVVLLFIVGRVRNRSASG